MKASWHFKEISLCDQCSTRSETWDIKFDDDRCWWLTEGNSTICYECLAMNLKRVVDSAHTDSPILMESGIDVVESKEIAKSLLLSNPFNDEAKYGTRVLRCASCLGIDGNDNFVTAIFQDGSEAQVHRSCREDCNICNADFVRYLRWRRLPDGRKPVMDFFDLNDDRVCRNCFDEYSDENSIGQCENCEGFHDYGDMQEFQGNDYCERCHDNNVYTCDDCGEEYWDGNHWCDDSNLTIHSYDYKPSPYFFPEYGKPYYFGFELEVEARESNRVDAAKVVQDIIGHHGYLKNDGSLNDGFEIVTHPHTLESYKSDLNWSWLDYLRRHRFISWNTETCGLHVHVSRTAFGDEQGSPRHRILSKQAHELRFMKLIYDNQGAVERLAGRKANQYTSFADKGRLVSKVKQGNQYSGRYSAINTENEDTIEVRIFKGSINKERILSAIEFVHASVEYTRNLKVTGNNKSLAWPMFISYVVRNADVYPNLISKINESFAREFATDDND